MKKKFASFLILSLILLLSGCVSYSEEPKLTQKQKQKRLEQSTEIHTKLAERYYSRGQYQIAIDEASIALTNDPEYALSHNILGLIYMALEQDVIAHQYFKQALSIDSEHPDINNNYGWFLCQSKPEQLDEAFDYFMVALNDPLYSTPEKSYTNMGVCELKRNAYETASGLFKKALTLHPMYSLALIGLIEIDFKKENFIEANTKISHYLTHSSPTPKILALGIQIAQSMGDHYAEDSYSFQLQKNFPNSKEALVLRQSRIKQ